MASSVALSIVIAFIAFSILRGSNTELTRSRIYSGVINNTHLLNVLIASFKEGSGWRDIREVREILLSLDVLLKKISSQAPPEEVLIKQLQQNHQDLGPLIDRTGHRVVIPDVRKCDLMADCEDMKMYLQAGIRA